MIVSTLYRESRASVRQIENGFYHAKEITFAAQDYNSLETSQVTFSNLGWIKLLKLMEVLTIPPEALMLVFAHQVKVDRGGIVKAPLSQFVKSFDEYGYFRLDPRPFCCLAQILVKPIRIERLHHQQKLVGTIFPSGEFKFYQDHSLKNINVWRDKIPQLS